jgi:hypothetical protein
MNTLQVLKYGLSLTLDGYRQLAFINKFLKPLVNKHSKRLGYKLSPSEKKKVLFYYPMYTVLACAQMYVTLKGRRLTKAETKRLTLVGAMATICDDLIDEDNWTREQIFQLLSNNLDEEGLTIKAQLLISLNRELQQFWKLSDEYLRQLKMALHRQASSELQLNAAVSLEDIINISREKNGHTSLMFATLVDERWNNEELQFIYQSAIVGQLTNDSFDMYFDTQNSIHTYFNTAPTIADVRKFFLDECTKLHGMVMACDTSHKNKLNTIRRMSILHAFTLTALDQFQQTEDKYGKGVDWKIVPRKDLIVDMALNKKRFKTVRYMKWLSKVIPKPFLQNRLDEVESNSVFDKRNFVKVDAAENLNKAVVEEGFINENITLMKREAVKSSAIKNIGYDEENQVLEVEILGTGEVYQYKNVPIEEYFFFLEQPSLGTYYNKEFKKKFPDYIKVS